MSAENAVEYLSIVLILANFALMASSRINVCVKAAALQGALLAVVPALREGGHMHTASVVLCVITLAVKGWIFPKLLLSTLRQVGIRREVEPLVGHTTSLVCGLAMLVFAFWLQSRLHFIGGGDLLLPASFHIMLSGFFMTLARRKAITQVLGYLVLENGIFAFGAASLSEHVWMLELGILLDLFVAVLIMGIAVFHINREFDHIDVDRLASLHDGGEEQ